MDGFHKLVAAELINALNGYSDFYAWWYDFDPRDQIEITEELASVLSAYYDQTLEITSDGEQGFPEGK